MDASRSTGKRIKSDLTCPLPDEIVEDILSRLPAKSLRRFQCVSRWFQATVASPVFQDAHYQRNKGKRRLFIKPPSRHREPLYAWQPSGAAVVEEIMSGSHLPQGSIFPVCTKSCRGLVLLSCLEYHTHYVWNPSTREMLTLPDNTPLRAARTACPTPSRRPFVSYGLGYCSATQRHKVVRMYCTGDHCRGSSSLPPPTICEVFTLADAESACWRPAAAARPPQQHYPRQNWRQGAVFCNGNLYFLQAGGDITTFNVSDETFGMLLKPPPELQSCSNFEMTELGGCLCVYTFTQWWSPPYQESANTCAIWLLRETGGWEKICSIDWGSMLQADHAHLTSSWIGPLDMYRDGNNQMKIMFATGYANVFIVDPSTGGSLEILFSPEEEDTTIIGVGERHRNDQLPTVGLFEESLAWVGNAGESERNLFSSPSVQAWSEVLSRLPSRTVGSLSQVCRGWRAMIKAGRFLAAHLCNANVHKSPEMMFFGGKPYGFTPVKDFIINSTRNVHVPPLIDEGSNVVCSKPCHGLNAGSFPYFDFVCNPITGYFKALPLDCSRDLKGLSLYEFLRKVPLHAGDAMLAGRLGLGYEKETSRHVLVRLECKGSNMTTRHDYNRLVCKMRYVEDMFWVKADPPPRPIGSKPPAYMNGKLYWMADTEPEQKLQGHQEIIVLDINKRKFEVVQGPPCNHDHMSIFELQQVICVTCSHQSTDNVLIWAMDDKGSWFAKYHIELGRHWPEYSAELVTPLAVNPVDGRILLSTGRALGYYDPNTTELETIYRLGKHIIGKKFLPVLFQESLINPHDPMF